MEDDLRTNDIAAARRSIASACFFVTPAGRVDADDRRCYLAGVSNSAGVSQHALSGHVRKVGLE